jgi:hypothetical protein
LLTLEEGVPPDVEEEFLACFSPRERTYVYAAMKGMFCTNLAVNTQMRALSGFVGTDKREQVQSCRWTPPSD